MFSAMNRLGERPDESPEWYGIHDVDQQMHDDVDFVRVSSYAPDAGFPPQRINTYDAMLEPPVTLDGVRVVAPSRPRNFMMFSSGPKRMISAGAPRASARVTPMTATTSQRMFAQQPVRTRW